MLVFAKTLASALGGEDAEGLVWRLLNGEVVLDLRLLCCGTGNNLVEIMDAEEAMKPQYAKRRVKVVGMAYGERRAHTLLADMLCAHMQKGGTVYSFKQKILQMEERA